MGTAWGWPLGTSAMIRMRDENVKPGRGATQGGTAWGREFKGNCRKCGKWGHMARYCNVRNSESPCGMCGNGGHRTEDCMLNVRRGCRKCGNSGHDEAGCKFTGKALNWQ